ncbi:MAG TPA: DUF3293 domain-containing protein [Burkholderiales bacterium]|nr:DUF3293 domain-containing protein [Burkholderiales bacterium]
MALDAEVLDAYRKADYVVFGEPPLVLRIGEPNRRLDGMLEAASRETAAFVTACNARGERRSDADNQAAQVRLERALEEKPYGCYPGEGRDPEGRWPAEPSLLVVGIPQAEAEALGRAFGQNAIVFLERGKVPRLLVLA